jgi:hypothetical protein
MNYSQMRKQLSIIKSFCFFKKRPRSPKAGLRQSRQNCKIFGQARRPAPTKACRGDSLWSPGFKKFDFDAALSPKVMGVDFF